MTELIDYVVPVGLALAGFWVVKTYLIDPAGAAGRWVGEKVLTPVYYGAQYPNAALWAISHGYPLPVVPETPAGYLPSNWTWTLPGGESLGLPAGMTPEQFCGLSPASPFCGAI